LTDPQVEAGHGDQRAERVPHWPRARILLIVALYAAAVYLPFLGAGRTMTRHEVIVTLPALQMLKDGNWLVPHYTNHLWVDKPPLVGWITAALFAATGGFSELAARLPAALSAIGLCVLMAGLAYRFLGGAAALLAGLVQATCVYGYMQGRLGEIDMPFTLLVAAAQTVLVWHWGRGEIRLPLPSAALFHTLAGLAVLAKGPVAVAFLGATILGFCLIRRTLRPLRVVLWTPAVTCFFVVALWWYVAVWAQVGDAALERWSYNYVDRFSGEHHLGAQTALLYLASIPWLALPCTLVLVIGARRLVRDVRRPGAVFERFLWLWFLAGLIPLLISAFKHKHYAIPVLPPLSILTAKLLAEHLAQVGRRARDCYVGFFAVTVVVLAIVGAVVLPARDPRRATADFVRTETKRVPAEAKLYVVGLAQSAVYPYVQHAWVGLNSLDEVRSELKASAGRPVWMLTLRAYLPAGAKEGIQLQEMVGEPARKKYPPQDMLVLGRVSVLSTQPAPTD
jgi:4-amino-4-deoxy-L-arabinose transferase-like glycosyltransferase